MTDTRQIEPLEFVLGANEYLSYLSISTPVERIRYLLEAISKKLCEKYKDPETKVLTNFKDIIDSIVTLVSSPDINAQLRVFDYIVSLSKLLKSSKLSKDETDMLSVLVVEILTNL